MTDTYEVGYQRPPLHTRFKKGAPSPNPSGRRKGSRNLTTVLQAALLAPTRVRDHRSGKDVTMTTAEVVVKKLVMELGKNNMQAAKVLKELITWTAARSQPANDADAPGDGAAGDPGDDEIIRHALDRLRPPKGGDDE